MRHVFENTKFTAEKNHLIGQNKECLVPGIPYCKSIMTLQESKFLAKAIKNLKQECTEPFDNVSTQQFMTTGSKKYHRK